MLLRKGGVNVQEMAAELKITTELVRVVLGWFKSPLRRIPLRKEIRKGIASYWLELSLPPWPEQPGDIDSTTDDVEQSLRARQSATDGAAPVCWCAHRPRCLEARERASLAALGHRHRAHLHVNAMHYAMPHKAPMQVCLGRGAADC